MGECFSPRDEVSHVEIWSHPLVPSKFSNHVKIRNVRSSYSNPNKWFDLYSFVPPPQESVELRAICRKLRQVSSDRVPEEVDNRKAAQLWQLFSCTARLRSPEGTFTVHKIYGDGNCMFRAVSFILWGTEEEHHSLRALVVHHIVDHWREHAPFVIAEWNISNPQDYLDFMKNEGVFASELECTIATKLYGLNLSIYRRITDYDVKRVFHNRVSNNQETARLLFTGRSDSGHYDVLFLDP